MGAPTLVVQPGAGRPLPRLGDPDLASIQAGGCRAAYLVEISVNAPIARETWRQWRWVLWLAGTLFALLVAQYWIGDEIYPSVR